MLSSFFEQNIIAIYFFYGLAFFSMGLAIWGESFRASDFPLALAMAPLAGFGIIHGIHEWVDMFQLMNLAGATAVPEWLISEPFQIILLSVSFALLTVFGVHLIYMNHRKDGRERLVAYLAGLAILIIWFISVLATNYIFKLNKAELMTVADIQARYILAVPGSLLAVWAILLEQRTFKARGMPTFGRALIGAAIALFFYGTLGQIFTKPGFFFPSNIINSDLFLSATGLPVQLFRTFCAIAMALFIVQALRAFEYDKQQRLRTAQEAEKSAQQKVFETQAKAQEEVEQINRELQEAVRNLSSLYTFSRSLVTTLDQHELLERAVPEFVNREPHISAGIVFLRNHLSGLLEITVQTQCPADKHLKEIMLEQATAVGEFVAKTGCSAWWNGLEVVKLLEPIELNGDLKVPNPEEPTGGRTLGSPLTIRDQIAGSLVMCTLPTMPPFTAREYSLVGTAADQLSIALQNADLYHEIQERGNLRGELLHQSVSAQEKERQRIARELHDGTGQKLTALGLGLAAVSGMQYSDPELTAYQLGELRKLCTSALKELHELISDLRPSVLDDLGLIPALRGQIRSFELRSGVTARYQISGARRRLDPDIETIIFRIVQEGLTNITKHALASNVRVRLAFEPKSVELEITDDGQGFDVDQALHADNEHRLAWGLLGMQERVSLAGGTYGIISNLGQGTTIAVNIPLDPDEVNINEQNKTAVSR